MHLNALACKNAPDSDGFMYVKITEVFGREVVFCFAKIIFPAKMAKKWAEIVK